MLGCVLAYDVVGSTDIIEQLGSQYLDCIKSVPFSGESTGLTKHAIGLTN